MDRAYSVLTVKAVNEDQRILEGWASTPACDRQGDVLEPLGCKYSLPLKLLWHHDSKNPVGEVEFAEATKEGIKFRARISKSTESGELKNFLDKCWHSLKAIPPLIGAVSVGFRAAAADRETTKTGFRFKRWEWLELSLVTIPANVEATITNIRSFDAHAPAPSGTIGAARSHLAAVAALTPTQGTRSMLNVQETIAEREAKRAAVAAGMEQIMQKAAGRVMDDSEKESFDDLADELANVDDDLRRYRALQKATQSLVPVNGRDDNSGSQSRALATKIHHGQILPPWQQPKEDYPGQILVRAALAIGAGKGSFSDTMAHASRLWEKQQPQVLQWLKANAGTIEPIDSSPPTSWGGQLVYPQNLVSEFVELLRAATVVGRLNGLRRIPFNVRIPVQISGSTVNWVAELGSKPVGELAYDFLTHGVTKIAGIVVASEELVRLSSPSAEESIRRDLTATVVQFMDEQFLDPAVTATAARPASITNGVTGIPASGTDANALFNDLNDALAVFDNAETGTNTIHIITTPALARGIGALRNALGQFEVPGVSVNGGTFMGFPVIVSNSCPSGNIILVKADEIFLSDDGGVRLDASNQATLDMDGGSPPTPTFNLWQRNCVGIRAERFVHWSKRRAASVNRITGAAYAPSTTSP